MSLGPRANATVAAGSNGQIPVSAIAKLTLPLPHVHDDALKSNSIALGLSHCVYLVRSMDGSLLPQPIAERQADRAAERR